MNNENRGSITQQGNLMLAENALVENVYDVGTTGYILISHAVEGINEMTFIELLRLNISRNTVILNTFGEPMCLCDIHKGMWVDAIFSPIMTRSIPPQSNAFLVIARTEYQHSVSDTTDRIAYLDPENSFLFTGDPDDINTQMRFVITDTTSIRDSLGNPITTSDLHSGQLVRVSHANFQTASIPPQTTAFYIQLLQ
jgi:hypothetical protein